MRIIKNSRLRELASLHPTCVPAANQWKKFIINQPGITNFAQPRRRLPHADQVTVKSGRTVTIFNLASRHRLLTAIHYNHQVVFILRLLTHAEYSKNNWKHEL